MKPRDVSCCSSSALVELGPWRIRRKIFTTLTRMIQV